MWDLRWMSLSTIHPMSVTHSIVVLPSLLYDDDDDDDDVDDDDMLMMMMMMMMMMMIMMTMPSYLSSRRVGAATRLSSVGGRI